MSGNMLLKEIRALTQEALRKIAILEAIETVEAPSRPAQRFSEWKMKNGRLSANGVHRLRSLIDKGWYDREISKDLGLTPPAVAYQRRRYEQEKYPEMSAEFMPPF